MPAVLLLVLRLGIAVALKRAVAGVLATGVIWFYIYMYSTGALLGWAIPVLSALDSVLTFTVAEDYLERRHGLLALLYLLTAVVRAGLGFWFALSMLAVSS